MLLSDCCLLPAACFEEGRRAWYLFSPNYLVCPVQHVRRDREANLLRRFEIDDELELLRLFYGNVGGFSAL